MGAIYGSSLSSASVLQTPDVARTPAPVWATTIAHTAPLVSTKRSA